MKKPLILPLAAFMLLVAAAVCAQPNYKYILKHLDTMSDREALYRLSDYQSWNPKKPQPYYLMANIYYRLLQDEHPIADYSEKQKMIYSATVFYGNCRAFIKNDHVKPDMYPLAAKDGKISEDMLSDWLTHRIDTLNRLKTEIEALYSAYSAMAFRYDTCQMLFTDFSTRYQRLKNAQMMLDSADMEQLEKLRATAAKLPDDIQNYQKALKKSPIPGYKPVFKQTEVSLYRIDGLTATNFLQNNVIMWDYLSWVNDFIDGQKHIDVLHNEIISEQRSLAQALDTTSRTQAHEGGAPIAAYKENNRLLNKINKYDEQSPLVPVLHSEYLTATAEQLEARIRNEMMADNNDWLIPLQLALRLRNTVYPAEADKSGNPNVNATALQAKYRFFLQEFFSEPDSLELWLTSLIRRRQDAWVRTVALLANANGDNEMTLQINNTTEAVLTPDNLIFRPVTVQPETEIQ